MEQEPITGLGGRQARPMASGAAINAGAPMPERDPEAGLEPATPQEQQQYETFMGAIGSIFNDPKVYPKLVQSAMRGDPREAVGNAVAQAAVRAAEQVGKPELSVIFGGLRDGAVEAMDVIDQEREKMGEPEMFGSDPEMAQGVVMRATDMGRAALFKAGFISKEEVDQIWAEMQAMDQAGTLAQALKNPAAAPDVSPSSGPAAQPMTRQQRRRAKRRAAKKARRQADG